ncbi:MAG TPA: APC family permease [Trebonia sp.]|nr:APC family permease [Trebonia sp.]
MQEATPQTSALTDDDDARLASLGYSPQLNRVLGLFSNFSVAFTYLSPIVGVYSLFVLGVGSGGPAYVWTTWLPVAGMLLVALVFGELASHYPIAGALYQYSKYNVGRRYGWFVGWFYGIALLVTVASVDTGVVAYACALLNNWFGTSFNPTSHLTILLITLILLAIQTLLNVTGTKVMGRVAQFGVYVEILGTLGLAIVLAIHGFHHGLGYLFSTQNVEHVKTNPLGLDFGGSYFGALIIAVLAPVYIFYGFESAGDISEETKDAGRQVPRAMRHALIWGGVASFIIIAALLLSIPNTKDGFATAASFSGGVPYILAQLPSWLQDFALLLLVFAFFSCGTSIQGAGSRLMFSYARDGALPRAKWIASVHPKFKTPVNALLSGAVVTVLFVLFVFATPTHDMKILWFTYPANTSALVSLVSFGTSGIYLSFFLTVLGVGIARARGWVPEGKFQLGRWAWPVTIVGGVYLLLMFINMVAPTGLASPRGMFNLDWITLLVMVIVFLVGAIVFIASRGGKEIDQHMRDDAEKPAAVRN